MAVVRGTDGAPEPRPIVVVVPRRMYGPRRRPVDPDHRRAARGDPAPAGRVARRPSRDRANGPVPLPGRDVLVEPPPAARDTADPGRPRPLDLPGGSTA